MTVDLRDEATSEACQGEEAKPISSVAASFLFLVSHFLNIPHVVMNQMRLRFTIRRISQNSDSTKKVLIRRDTKNEVFREISTVQF